MELAVSAKLWSFIAEDWAVIEAFDWEVFGGIELMLNDGSRDARGEFWAHGDGAVSFVEEGIHLLTDDVAAFAGRTVEDIGVFQGWDAEFLVAIKLGHRFENALDISISVGFFAEDIVCSFDCNCWHSFSFL